MEKLIFLLLISITAVGITIFWRTCIYTRGAIFRPIGRMFDVWVNRGCEPSATFGDKLLRFIAYPMGRCAYCSSFHFTYYIFFLFNSKFSLELSGWFLIPVIAVMHLLLILVGKTLLNNNADMAKGDWDYIKEGQIFDVKRRASKIKSPFTRKEEVELDYAQNN